MKGLTVKDIKMIETAVFHIRHNTYIIMCKTAKPGLKAAYKELILYYDLIDRLNKLTVRS